MMTEPAEATTQSMTLRLNPREQTDIQIDVGIEI